MSQRARLYGRALLAWVGLFVLAFLNGALREFVLAPLLGASALPLSGVTALLAFGVVIALFVRRSAPSVGDAVVIGLAWFTLTLMVEVALVMAQGRPASVIADVFSWRSISGGNLFAVLVLFVALAPPLFAWNVRR